jgi:MFS family permease
LGLNEASGYIAVAFTAYATGLIAQSAGLRPAPFFLGIAVAGLGLGVSALLVHETRGHALAEAAQRPTGADESGRPGWLRLAWDATIRDPSLSAASQAGLVNNLNDGLAWGLMPIVWSAAGLDLAQVGLLAAAYPATWGIVQVATGDLSDRIGRKPLIVTGMLIQAGAIAAMAVLTGLAPWLFAAIALGLGTAMVYPTLLAVVADVADPRQRGAVNGVYRFWRDLGFAVGAVLIGVVSDRFDARAAILVVASLTAISGLVVAMRMRETRPAR